MLINLLQRHHLWIFIFLSGICGLALGHLGSTSISVLTAPAFTPEQTIQSKVKETTIKTPLSDYQTILDRDIFNSAGGTQNLTETEPIQTETPKPTKTASKWTLLGTISGGDSPLATLSNAGETAIYRLDETLPDDSVLALIERNRVELRYPDGQTIVLEVLESTQAKGRSKPSRSKASNNTDPGTSALQVEKLGENRWLIPAGVAEDARSNIGNLLTQAQAVPYIDNNVTIGFQIRMIQSGSLIAQLGLKKGDILREVNGVALNSPEKALQVFGQLRQAKQISIGLERRGKNVTFAYEVR